MSIKRNESLDFLTVEVGSTITKANGFHRSARGSLIHVAQGFAATSVAQGDVGIGVTSAVKNLIADWMKSVSLPHNDDELAINPEKFAQQIYLNSSAAGGLRMTVHGLTYSMTARAAREASLGAGAIVKQVTAGLLTDDDLDEIKSISPNIILLAGGVDFGERDIVLKNAEKLVSLNLSIPFVYAGNTAIQKNIKKIFADAGKELLIAQNVFPDVDILNIEPLRTLIQEVFSRHIIHAPGMENLQKWTKHNILPTPGAVLLAAELFAEVAGDAIIFDVGGATTDVHSVTEGSLEYAAKLLEPEPRAKRTVEGDLGVFINAHNIAEMHADPNWEMRMSNLRAMPQTEQEKELTRWLCHRAVEVGAKRHAGVLLDTYTPTGKKQLVKGKDLTAVKWVIGTGGALTRVEGGVEILKSICIGATKHLLPSANSRILLDQNYLFSALGTIAQEHPDLVRQTFVEWIEQAN